MLLPTYPNPANAGAILRYRIASRQYAVLRIYNALGQRVRNVVARDHEVGSYSTAWDGTSDSGQPLATGVYFVRLELETLKATQKILILK